MEQQVYQNMASALGIDLSETEDIISQMVKLGIDDLDPTRVLRDCTHMFCTLSRQGHNFFHLILAQQLQLPTMGAKVLHCSLQYTRVGLLFEETYGRFRHDYSDKCPDRDENEVGNLCRAYVQTHVLMPCHSYNDFCGESVEEPTSESMTCL